MVLLMMMMMMVVMMMVVVMMMSKLTTMMMNAPDWSVGWVFKEGEKNERMAEKWKLVSE